MASPTGVRQRPGKEGKRPRTPNPETPPEKLAGVVSKARYPSASSSGRDWDYKAAVAVLTVLAFITRFWGINYPDQVVFDEVHFGKVGCLPPPLSTAPC